MPAVLTRRHPVQKTEPSPGNSTCLEITIYSANMPACLASRTESGGPRSTVIHGTDDSGICRILLLGFTKTPEPALRMPPPQLRPRLNECTPQVEGLRREPSMRPLRTASKTTSGQLFCPIPMPCISGLPRLMSLTGAFPPELRRRDTGREPVGSDSDTSSHFFPYAFVSLADAHRVEE